MFCAVVLGVLNFPATARAVTTVFFNSAQVTNLVASGTTSDTISSEGYLFTVTRDKLFTGGVGLTNPIGRYIRVPWPLGMEAQAVTAGPNPGGAKLTIRRVDGQSFGIETLTLKLLANTAGAGASFEIMPKLNGEDGAADPFMYDATGYYGGSFTYHTPDLIGFDTYVMSLYVDFALTSLTVVDASLPPPRLDLVQVNDTTIELSWPASAAGYALESATNLTAPAWSPVTNNVVANGDLLSVQVPAGEAQRFFRLKK